MDDLEAKKGRINQTLLQIGKATDKFSKMMVEGLTRAKDVITMMEEGDEEGLLNKLKEDYQGGFSDDIFNGEDMLEYYKQNYGELSGFIGLNDFRNANIDQYLEQKLIEKGLTTREIEWYISSKSGRKDWDEYNSKVTREETKIKMIDNAIDGIYEDIKDSMVLEGEI